MTQLDRHIISQIELLSKEGKKHLENMFVEKPKRLSKKERIKNYKVINNY